MRGGWLMAMIVLTGLAACGGKSAPLAAGEEAACEDAPLQGGLAVSGEHKETYCLPKRDPFADSRQNAAQAPQRDLRAVIDKVHP